MVSLMDQYETDNQDNNDFSDEMNPVGFFLFLYLADECTGKRLNLSK
jgi:hypothetical protein